MQCAFCKVKAWKLWVAAGLSAGLLELPFPLAGPLPVWRTAFAWLGLVPLLWALLSPACVEKPRPLRHGFLVAYFCGVLWYLGNGYWVRDTMLHYGDLPLLAPTLLLVAFSLYLGLYFGLFGLSVALVRRATGSTRVTLVAAPFLWTALELAAARITSFPWDQLGDSQVDNALLNQLAPWTGAYGISFVLVAVNALLAGGLLLDRTLKSAENPDALKGHDFSRVKCRAKTTRALGPEERFQPNTPRPSVFSAVCSDRRLWGLAGLVLMACGTAGIFLAPPRPAATASAILIQPNLNVGEEDPWSGPGEWDHHIAEFERLASGPCVNGKPASSEGKTYIAGIPQTGAPSGEITCPPNLAHPELVIWPESPAPFAEGDARFQQALTAVARQAQAPLIVGNVGMDFSIEEQAWHEYNSALVIAADGARVGRYDKIHLVPFGEYIPFKRLLFFAHKLTGQVSEFSRGDERKIFRLNGHRYGVFICYEAVFADEVRQFAQLGAEALINVSDDGWYGDTSAPWQHLNMVRMRAIENRRWILRDTNNGVTAVIDPYGRVRQSIPRHQTNALPAQFGFRNDVTFYTAHGDVFAWVCAFIAFGLMVWSARKLLRRWAISK